MSNTYLAWLRKNLAHNKRWRTNITVRANCLQWLPQAQGDTTSSCWTRRRFQTPARWRKALISSATTRVAAGGHDAAAPLVGCCIFNNRRGFRLEPVLAQEFLCEDITRQPWIRISSAIGFTAAGRYAIASGTECDRRGAGPEARDRGHRADAGQGSAAGFRFATNGVSRLGGGGCQP